MPAPVRASRIRGRRAMAFAGFAAGLAGLTIQFCILLEHFASQGLGAAAVVVKLFSYFTILSNFLVVSSHGVTLLAPRTRLGRVISTPAFSSGVLLYIILVSTLYSLLLASSWSPQGWQKGADVLLHYIVPGLYLLFWLFFVPKSSLPWRLSIIWLSFPAVYLLWVLGRGVVIGDYPYAFMNPAKIGYPALFSNAAALTLVFFLSGLAIIAINRLHDRRNRRRR